MQIKSPSDFTLSDIIRCRHVLCIGVSFWKLPKIRFHELQLTFLVTSYLHRTLANRIEIEVNSMRIQKPSVAKKAS